LLIYAVVLVKSAQHEAQLHVELNEVMVNEGRFEAPMIGKTWPD
jgi:hypothetical protein